MTVAYPTCYVEVYPFEGGQYSIVGGQILVCQVHKNIRDVAGAFTINLAPGGPMGPNSGPSWLDIITPMSFVLIGMSRAGQSAIVMIGVVTSITESETWEPENPVRRTIAVAGQDFGYFFTSFNWNALTFLGPAATIIGGAIGDPGLGYSQAFGMGLLTGTPAEVAKMWYTKVMSGDSGILGQTYVNWAGRQVKFSEAMSYIFEEYPGFIIPYGDYFMTSDGSWAEKFRAILEWPFYEFFVITAPPNIYGASGGTKFTMKNLQGVSATPTLVGRLNPLPFVHFSAGGDGTVSINSVDTAKWDKLSFYQMNTGFMESSGRFSDEEVANFYMINPLNMASMYGQTNGNPVPYMYQYTGAVDPASAHRFGFKPMIQESHWFVDLKGQNAQSNAAVGSGGTPVDKLMTDLLARLVSYHEPVSMMMRGGIEYPLHPTMLPGNKIQYQPFKGEPLWTGYAEIVDHIFAFGGGSRTRIGFTRGLPTSVYNNKSLLGKMCIGDAHRESGQYKAGLPSTKGQNKPLEVINLANTASRQVIGDIAKLYVKPQGN